VVQDTLVGTWQRWLNDLGDRMDKHYGGVVADAGIWRPEHTAFLAQLNTRLAEVTGCLGQDGFSMNRAARALQGIVDDTLRFSASASKILGIDAWKDEARTAIALELAAARLLSDCAAPVMPRFAGRLAAALGLDEPSRWPQLVTLVPAGTKVDLARQVFFGAQDQPEAQAPESPLLPWLSEKVREALRLPEDQPVADATLVSLGVESMQAITLQYQILEETGADVTVEDLLGDRTVAELAAFVSAQEPVVAENTEAAREGPVAAREGVGA
jgi:methionyl-tRNA synthetase